MDRVAQRSTKDVILETALDLFSRKGFYAVSVREITRQVGIKESSLYNHFKSKNDIILEIINRFQAELDAFHTLQNEKSTVDEIPEHHNAKAVLWKDTASYIKFWDDSFREKLWLVISLEQYRNPKAAEMLLLDKQRMLTIQKNLFQKWFEHGIIRSGDLEMLAFVYVEVIRSMHLDYRLLKATEQNTDKIRKHMRRFIDFFLLRAQEEENKA